MNHVILSVPIDPVVKRKAEEKAEKDGVSLEYFVESVLDKVLKDFIGKKTIGTDIHIRLTEEPSEYFKKAIKKADKDRKEGKGSPLFKNAKESIEWLEKQGI